MALNDYRINRQQWPKVIRLIGQQMLFFITGDFALTVELLDYERVNVIQAGTEMQPGKVHTAVHNILIREKSRWKQF